MGVIVSYIVAVGVVVMGVVEVCLGAYSESLRSLYLFTLEL